MLSVVGCGEGVVYLTSRGVQLILAYSWASPAILEAGKSRVGNVFIRFLHFHSCSPFFPVSLFHLLYYLLYLLSPLLRDTTKMIHKGLRVVKYQHYLCLCYPESSLNVCIRLYGVFCVTHGNTGCADVSGEENK